MSPTMNAHYLLAECCISVNKLVNSDGSLTHSMSEIVDTKHL